MPSPKVPGTLLTEFKKLKYCSMLRIRICRIRMFLGLPYPHSDPLVRGADTDPYRTKVSRIRNTGSVYAVIYN
jgi:hypothetical protein